MRELHDHKVNPLNDKLTVAAMDEPGSGGAHHRYEITGFTAVNPGDDRGVRVADVILFQNGPINDAGINGLTQEILLAIVADRLRAFQKGPFSTDANGHALQHVEEAMHWLQQRTLERMRRGVEGTLQK